jgi:hypothetical protein
MSDFAEDLKRRADWIKKPFHTTIDWQNVANLLNCELAEAYAKIEAMKCCGNCKNYDPGSPSMTGFCEPNNYKETSGSNKCDKWEMK